ncbi:hypothetical protein SDC9_142553 [bioreactor metagenome]|uniref:Uncharacterized protein n=1 Tax=bioreactor metagenome TaxID=1076179 RepID=A0A645E1H2_9ZZZZ
MLSERSMHERVCNLVLADIQVDSRLFIEFCDHAIIVAADDAESRSLFTAVRLGGDGQFSSAADMPVQHFLEVHAIELITAEDDVVVSILVMEMLEVLANSICCSLIPRIGLVGLFCCQNLNETI